MMACVFCDSQFVDPIQPASRQKICQLFELSLTAKKVLHDGRICCRCQLQVDIIDNAAKLKSEMSQILQEKLNPSVASQPTEVPKLDNGERSPSVSSHHSSGVTPTTQPPTVSPTLTPTLAANLPLTLPTTLPTNPVPSAEKASFMCVKCGTTFGQQQELVTHSLECETDSGRSSPPITCDRCHISLKYKTVEERVAHMMQCRGSTVRRGRPSTGIFNCHKCGLSLKNRMSCDRLNHVQRCTGSGLKRGRPSLKSVEKYQCDKCQRNLWSRDQLEAHAAKCDGTHVERRGRKPGDNSCMVCGENLVYRHLLKKHLRQAHGIKSQSIDDRVISAIRNLSPSDDLDIPYKKALLDQVQQQLSSDSITFSIKAEPEDSSHSESSVHEGGHRKQTRPMKYIVDELFTCNSCNKRFEHKLQYETHCCFRLGERDVEHNSLAVDENGAAIGDVVSEISSRAAGKREGGGMLAQVISGLHGNISSAIPLQS